MTIMARSGRDTAADNTGVSPKIAARHFAAEIAERAAEGEAGRSMPIDLVHRMREARLFSLTLPRALGGLQADPDTIIGVVEQIASADGSAGWTLLIGQSSGFLGWVDPEVGTEIVTARPNPILAGSMAPTGVAQQAEVTGAKEPNYLLRGRWAFNSGCRHADWMVAAFLVRDGEQPVIAPNGQPMVRFGLVRKDDVTIVDSWRVLGLRGTGSDDMVIDGVVIPHRWTFNPFLEGPRHDGALYRLSFFSFLMVTMAGFSLGVGRRALDEITSTAHGKSRSATRRKMIEDPLLQTTLLRAQSKLRAARLLVFDAVETLWAEVTSAGAAAPEVRARTAAAVQHAQRTAEDVVRLAFHAAGDEALYTRHQLQRCWRDISAAGQHIAFGADTERRVARSALGLDNPLVHLL